MTKRTRPQKECDHCGERIPYRALACPHCGSDADTGWADPEEIEYQSVEIPEEWPAEAWSPERETALPRWVRLAAILALAAMGALLLVRLLLAAPAGP